MNETTGVAPYTMVYGRLQQGPLALLKDMWTNEVDYAKPKNQSTIDFLKDLRQKLEVARSFADSHADKAQKQYVARYNKRSCDKYFQVGVSVLVLQKDSTASKVFSRWIGPVIVMAVQSPHSYLVEFNDGSRRIVHANHLRKFHTRVQTVIWNLSIPVS